MTNDKVGFCPFCKQEYVVTDEILGASVTCPNPECEKTFAAAAAEEPSTPAADIEEPSPREKDAAPPADTSGLKLRKMKADDFKVVHPDTLIAHISQSPILKTFAIAVAIHVVLIAVLSIGNVVMCLKYKTFSVTGAVAEHAAMLQEQKVAEKKAERAKAQAGQKSKRDAQAKRDPEKEPTRVGSQAAGTERAAPETSAIEKELSETSSERPTESSLSLDDMDDGL